MPRAHIVRRSAIVRSPRVLQLEGMFDVPAATHSEQIWDVDLPLDAKPWRLGAVVGPSGAGKSTVARELFGAAVVRGYDWPTDRSVVDGFPAGLSIKAVTALLSSVGFASPPTWLRPFGVLSTGQQFRVTLARALAEAGEEGLVVMDEFTSVVDRTVAQIGSAALAKTIRRSAGQRFVAVTCHYDVLDWLQPDWIFEPHLGRFTWRALQCRPGIDLRIRRAASDTWAFFRGHHYLSADLHRSARCFVATWRDQPVAFTAVLSAVGYAGKWREHRTVCLPDFQGVGIGNAMSRTVAALTVAATRGEYRSVTSHPSFIRARAQSSDWRLVAAPRMSARSTGAVRMGGRQRLAATFHYVGAPWPDASEARTLWGESFTAKRMRHSTTSGASA